jgi:hypothetical protein
MGVRLMSMNVSVVHLTGVYLIGVHLIGYACHRCYMLQTGMYILIVEALLVAIYLPKKDAYMYIRPTSHPHHLGT